MEAGYAEEEAGDAKDVDEWLISLLRAPFIQVSPGMYLNYFFTSCFTSCLLAISVLCTPFIQVSPGMYLNLYVYI